jgi:hypothetical protein
LKKQPVRLAANWLPLSQARFPQAALLLLIEIRTRRERHAGAGDFWLSLKRRTDPPVRLSARKSAA